MSLFVFFAVIFLLILLALLFLWLAPSKYISDSEAEEEEIYFSCEGCKYENRQPEDKPCSICNDRDKFEQSYFDKSQEFD